jgi:IS4 transposase
MHSSHRLWNLGSSCATASSSWSTCTRKVRWQDAERSLAELAGRWTFRRCREVTYRGQTAVQHVAQADLVLDRPAWRKHRRGGRTINERVPGSPIALRLVVSRVCDATGRTQAIWYLLSNVPAVVDTATLALWYYWRWRIEVFYRSLKQTLGKRRLLSRTSEAARCELTWALFGLWLLGLLTVEPILARGGDPLAWSAAKARNRVRRSMRRALSERPRDRTLVRDLAWATQDGYVRCGSKKARDWPHKKKETPPGEPKIRSATAAQRRAAKRLKTKQARQ